MQEIKYNQFPEGFKHPYEEVKKMGEKRIVFRLLNMKKSNDPDPEINGRLEIPSITHVSPKSTIAIDGEIVTIAAANERTGDLFTGVQFLASRQGMLALSPKNPRHIPLIKWMLLTPRNSKSPFAGQDGRACIFETVNFEVESQSDAISNERKAEAVMTLAGMAEDGLRDAYHVIFQKSPAEMGMSQVKVALQDLAFSDPDKLLKAIVKKEINLEAMAREAKDLKIIKNAQADKAFKLIKSGDTFFEYESGGGSPSPYSQLAEFLANNKEAQTKLKAMIDLVKT